MTNDAQRPPAVSVIIPVFNDLSGALACLDALSRQTYPVSQFEVILVDNGSIPPINISKNYLFALKLARCETPGSYAARNAGVRISRGAILAFTDADCEPRNDWIENGTKALHDSPSHDFVGGEVSVSPPNPRSGTGLYQHLMGFQQKENIEHKGFAVTANLFCRSDLFHRVGNFDERLLSGGDREWAWRAFRLGFTVGFAPIAIVKTAPRTSLGAAIRQTRRVTAGRYHLGSNALDWSGPGALAPHRGARESIVWIFAQNELTGMERGRVLAAAAILRATAFFENIRLRFGARAERR